MGKYVDRREFEPGTHPVLVEVALGVYIDPNQMTGDDAQQLLHWRLKLAARSDGDGNHLSPNFMLEMARARMNITAALDAMHELLKGSQADASSELDAKQQIAKSINAICKQYGLYIAHPDTNDPCTLLVANDRYGGKYLLENRKTKRRSRTTADIWSLFPLKLLPLGRETGS